MNSMKKAIGMIVGSSMLITGLLGCSNAETGNKEKDVAQETQAVAGTNKTPEDQKVTLKFHYWANDAAENRVIDRSIEAFENAHVNTKIQKVKATGDYFASLLSDFSAGSAADVFFMKPGEIAPFIDNGALLSLDAYLAESTLLKESDLWEINNSYRYDKASNQFFTGSIFGFIKDWSPDFMLFYNEDLLKQQGVSIPTDRPLTWAEFKQIAQSLNVKEGNSFSQYGSYLDFSQYEMLLQMISQAGGEIFSDDFKSIAFDHAGTRKAFESFIDLYVGDNPVSPYNPGGNGTGLGQFLQGKVGMILTGKWFMSSLKDSSINWKVALPPMPEGVETPVVISSGMIGLSISADSDYPDRAYEFVEFMMTEGQKVLAENAFNIPGNKTVAKGVEQSADEKVRAGDEVIYDAGEKYIAEVPISPYLSQTKFLGFVKSAVESVIQGQATIDQAIEQLTADANKYIQRAVMIKEQ